MGNAGHDMSVSHSIPHGGFGFGPFLARIPRTEPAFLAAWQPKRATAPRLTLFRLLAVVTRIARRSR